MLVAPLNWGLGHATRCIPIINGLQKAGFEPVLASDGHALVLLEKEFPNLKSYQLPSYNINYSKRGNTLKLKLFLSIPSVLKAVKLERKQVAKIIEKEQLSGIISDNRFGVFSTKIPVVYVTHQLNVLSGITTYFTSKIHQKIASKYSEIWIPDVEGINNFSGKLSGFYKYNSSFRVKFWKNFLSRGELQNRIKFIGVLSRFQFENKSIKYDLTVVLSGVEPQRTFLEQKLLNELKSTSKKVLFIRGKLSDENIKSSKNIKVVNFLSSKELNTVLNQSKLVIARSGYSTIMDLAVLEKKAFFIPTSGQNEQEYLAKRMQHLKIATYSKQQDFSLEKLQEIENYKGFIKMESNVDLKLFSLFQSK